MDELGFLEEVGVWNVIVLNKTIWDFYEGLNKVSTTIYKL